MKKIPIILDCDPGVDDALAIILANASDRLDIKAITTVSGNVELVYTTRNALKIVGLLNQDIPVAKGADQPLVKKRVTAGATHGTDGFGGYAHVISDQVEATLSEKTALQMMHDVILESKDKITVVAIGPLTNIAILLLAYPQLKDKIERISIMGGGLGVGNVTPTAEFNFYVDPEAAQIVFNSGLPITMAGLNVTLQTQILKTDIEQIKNINNKVSDIAWRIMEKYQVHDSALHDPVAIYALTNPDMFEMEPMYIQVETQESATRGMSYVDSRGDAKPNCMVLTQIKREQFIQSLIQGLKYYD